MRLVTVRQYIQRHPGIRLTRLCHHFGLNARRMEMVLADMEEAGMLLFEDDGKLWHMKHYDSIPDENLWAHDMVISMKRELARLRASSDR